VFGAAMTQYKGGPLEDSVNPDDFVRAVLSALDGRLHEPEDSGSDVAATQRLLAVVAGVLPEPLSGSARDLTAEHLDDAAAQRATRGVPSDVSPGAIRRRGPRRGVAGWPVRSAGR